MKRNAANDTRHFSVDRKVSSGHDRESRWLELNWLSEKKTDCYDFLRFDKIDCWLESIRFKDETFFLLFAWHL